jgi:hypothetical protein
VHQELVAYNGNHAKNHVQILEGQRQLTESGLLALFNDFWGLLTSHSEELLLLNGLKTAHLANGDIHDSCMQGTRASVLDQARSWLLGENTGQLFWLADVAGAGKSTVANHLAKEWKSQKILAGRFFFSRDAEETRTPKYFFSTLAQQGLSHLGAKVQSAIIDGIRELRDPVSAPLEEQCHKLLVQPLQHVSFPVVLVLDGLDECEPTALIRLLRILSKEFPSLPRLKLFLTSRPESHIAESFEDLQVLRVSLRSDVDSNRNDVWKFIRENLKSIFLPDYKIDQLATRSEGLFIWASTVCRLLVKFRGDRDQFLSDVLVQGPHQMNSIYRVALQQALPDTDEVENIKIYTRVLGTIVVAFEPLCPNSINHLLKINNSFEIVRDLQSVLDCPDFDKPVRFLHPTFRDYLLQSIHNPSCYVDEQAAHVSMARSCLDILAHDLRWDICDLFYQPIGTRTWPSGEEEDYWAAEERRKEEIQQRLQQYTTHGLRYSCLFWAQHLNFGYTMEADMNETLWISIGYFFRHNLLDWMYLLSLIHLTGHPWNLLRKLKLTRIVGII